MRSAVHQLCSSAPSSLHPDDSKIIPNIPKWLESFTILWSRDVPFPFFLIDLFDLIAGLFFWERVYSSSCPSSRRRKFLSPGVYMKFSSVLLLRVFPLMMEYVNVAAPQWMVTGCRPSSLREEFNVFRCDRRVRNWKEAISIFINKILFWLRFIRFWWDKTRQDNQNFRCEGPFWLWNFQELRESFWNPSLVKI